jgi:uncharacterized protein
MMKVPFVVLLFSASLCLCGELSAADAPAEKKIRLLVTYGGHGFEEKPFWAMFDAMPNVTYTKSVMPKDAAKLKPGLEKEVDVIVMYDMSPPIKPEEQAAFVELLKTGIGVVALHHNMGAHTDWAEYPKIIGGKFMMKACEFDGKKYAQSGWKDGQDHNVTVVEKDHPIMKGVTDFKIKDETYNKYYVAPDVKVLLKTDSPTNDPNIAWVHEYGKSRVFYLMLGHDHIAWDCPSYRLILANGIEWAAGK